MIRYLLVTAEISNLSLMSDHLHKNHLHIYILLGMPTQVILVHHREHGSVLWGAGTLTLCIHCD